MTFISWIVGIFTFICLLFARGSWGETKGELEKLISQANSN